MKIYVLIIAICFLSVTNSIKAQIYGCTDPEAINYNSSANRNNGSCIYNTASVTPSANFNLAGNISETSGLICWNNQVWTHNDSDDLNLYALDSTIGNIIHAYPLSNVTNTDWEEIAQDADFVYVGDFGNNRNGNRTDLHILRIAKKTILAEQPVIETINFSYSNQSDFTPAGSNNTDFDCEAFIVSADSIFLFTKQWISNKTSVYSMLKTPGTHIAKLKYTFDVQGMITGATYLETRKLLVMSGYTNELQPFVYLFYDFDGNKFFGGNKRKIQISLPFHQVEGIATTNGLKYYISNENFSQPPYINTPQKLHILDLGDYLTKYLINPVNFPETQTSDNALPFPNPAIDFINIKTDTFQLPATYRIFDQSGHIVLTEKLTKENQDINISELPSGVYILKIYDDKMRSFKVIKE